MMNGSWADESGLFTCMKSLGELVPGFGVEQVLHEPMPAGLKGAPHDSR